MSKGLWADLSAVYVVRTRDSFVPSSPWNIPDAFSEAVIQIKNVHLDDARATVRAMNKAAMQRRQANPAAWDHLWAIAVANARDKCVDRMVRISRTHRPKARVES